MLVETKKMERKKGQKAEIFQKGRSFQTQLLTLSRPPKASTYTKTEYLACQFAPTKHGTGFRSHQRKPTMPQPCINILSQPRCQTTHLMCCPLRLIWSSVQCTLFASRLHPSCKALPNQTYPTVVSSLASLGRHSTGVAAVIGTAIPLQDLCQNRPRCAEAVFLRSVSFSACHQGFRFGISNTSWNKYII